MTAWRLRGIRKQYRPRGLWRRAPRTALDGVDLVVEDGERVAVIGASGSGKTTLARVGLGLVRADAGDVELLGTATTGWGASDWRRARSDAQLLFQSPRAMLHPALPIGLLLEESARLHRPADDPRAAAAEVLELVGLGARYRARPHELSGGEQRRAGIARLLLARPRLVVADEPTAGLDASLKAELLDVLLERVGPACAVVLISHDIATVLWACTRVCVMHEGRIVDAFAVAQLDEGRPRHARTAALLAAAGISVGVAS